MNTVQFNLNEAMYPIKVNTFRFKVLVLILSTAVEMDEFFTYLALFTSLTMNCPSQIYQAPLIVYNYEVLDSQTYILAPYQ